MNDTAIFITEAARNLGSLVSKGGDAVPAEGFDGKAREFAARQNKLTISSFATRSQSQHTESK
jgi:hypothetical protein